MNGEIIELERPLKVATDLSEEDLLAMLDAPAQTRQVRDIPAHSTVDLSTVEFETNSRLTVIKMFEQAPEFGQPFTFYVRKYCGEAHVQSMRTTLSKARKIAKEENFVLNDNFKMIVLDIQTRDGMDIVTVTRVEKGKKFAVKLTALARMMGGTAVQEDEEDD